MNKDKFIFLYSNVFGTLEPLKESGLRFLLGSIETDADLLDICQQAYLLATTKHETAGTWQPIAEYGKGKGRPYGKPDAKTGKTYYGRGYVQLTWKENYAEMGRILNIDLVNNPDLAMEPQTAYQIISYGMRHGTFTGKKLSDYVYDDFRDYINARRIINGTDCAELIAGYAKMIEQILMESAA